VLVGDMAMVLADRTLGWVSPETRAVWDGLRTELNMGQYLDVVGGARGSATADEARKIIEHKTARYTVVRPLQLGAALAGRPDLAEPLKRHGLPWAWPSNCETTSWVRSETRPPPASQSATTCGKASPPCSWPWREPPRPRHSWHSWTWSAPR